MKSKITLRQLALIVFGVLVSMAVANYDKLLPHRWQTYTSPDGKFIIELPDKPTVETIQAPVEGGGTMSLNVIGVKPTSHTAYTCAYFEHENVGKKSPDEALESARDGSLQKTQGTVMSQKRITVHGYPALEMQSHARGNSIVDSRIVVVGNRLYMIVAVATVEQDREEKIIQRVFESFKISKK